MVNKNIKRMLLFVTLCILLTGIVSAENYESDDSSLQADTISDQITDTAESTSEVQDNVVNDNNKNLRKEVKTEKSIKSALSKTSSVISIDHVPNVSVGDKISIQGSLREWECLGLSFYGIKLDVNGEEYDTETDYYGCYSYDYIVNKPGTNTITVSFAGNDGYESSSAKRTFTVMGQAPTYVELNEIHDTLVGNTVKVSGYYYYGNNTPLTYTPMRININGQTFTIKTDNNGYFAYSYKTTKTGTNTVDVSYPGNTNFKKASAYETFNAKTTGPLDTYIILNNIKEVTIGQTTTISGYYYYGSDIPLTLTTMRLNINGKTYTSRTDNKGYFTLSYKTTKDGLNTVTVSYPGNTNFKTATATKTFYVRSVGPQYTYIKLDDITNVSFNNIVYFRGYYYYGNDIPLTYTPMTINFNGQKYTVKTDSNGYFNAYEGADKLGKNTVTVSYHGNSNFKAATTTKTFTVKAASPIGTHIYIEDVKEVTVGEYATIAGRYFYIDDKYARGVVLTQTTMRININGQTYTTKTDDYGEFTYNYKTTKEGTNTVTVSYPGNTNFQKASDSTTFNVKSVGPKDTYIVLNNIPDGSYDNYVAFSGYYYYGNNIPLTYTPMTININGEKYTLKTDSKGYFSDIFWADKIGKNTVTVSYHGNNNFKAATATKTFTVKTTDPVYTYISLNDIADVKIGNYITIKGYYKYGNGYPLTQTTMRININGQTYTTKTDNNGYFRYDYKTTKSGTNTVTVSYPGNTNFQKAYATKKFEVEENYKIVTFTFNKPAYKSVDIDGDPFVAVYSTKSDSQYGRGVFTEIDTRGLEYPPKNKIIYSKVYFQNSAGNVQIKTAYSTVYSTTETSLISGYTPYKVEIYYRKRTDEEKSNW